VRAQVIFGTEVHQGYMVISRLGCDKFTTETNNLALEAGRSERPNINKAA